MRSIILPTAIAFTTTAAPAELPSDVLSMINTTYDPRVSVVHLDVDTSLSGCRIEHLKILGRDPVTNEIRAVTVQNYRSREKSSEAPTVILLPPTGGVNFLDQGYANALCSRGMNVAMIVTWDHKDDIEMDLRNHDRESLRSLAAVRHVIEFINLSNSKKIGILGTSVGAMTANLALGFDSRVSTGVLIVGSARFVDVLSDSNEKGVAKLRQARMSALHLSIDEYREALREAVHIDHTAFINFSGPKAVLVVTADQDLTVPTEHQLELVEQLHSEHLALSGDHFKVIKETFFKRSDQVVGFFQRHLDF